LKGRLGAPLTQVAFHFKQNTTSLLLKEGDKGGNEGMSKSKKAILFAFILLILFLCVFNFWQALKPSFSAIDYLEGKGYSSVRILYQVADGHGCKADDTYRFIFDAIPLEGKGRVEGKVCGDGTAIWYEEK